MSLIDSASLIVTPNAYKEGTLYSVIPSDGSGDLSVTRATTATRVNSQGLVELVPYNLLQYSQDFSNAYWFGEAGNTITSNTTTAPDGTLTADTFTATAGNEINVHNLNGFSLADGTFTYSIYLKNNGTNLIEAYLFKVGVGFAARGEINFSAGTFTASIGTGSIENVGNGWFRVSLTNTYTSGTFTTGTYTTSTTGTRSVFAWGAQLVEGSVAKDYQKTETRLNIPRLDYSNGTCPSLLVEPQRTNTILQSENLATTWTSFRSIVTTNVTTSPSGINNADKVAQQSGNNDAGGVYQTISVTNGTSYTYSFFAKADGYNWCFARVSNSPSDFNAWFNLSTGVVGSTLGGVTSSSITSYGNGWYRCSMTFTSVATTALPHIYIANSNLSDQTPNADGVKGIYIYGAQLEAGSYATSYIPTTSAFVTRNADVISKTGISSLIGQTEGVVFWEGYLPQIADVGGNNISNILNTEKSVDTKTAIAFQFISNLGKFRVAMFIGNGTFSPIFQIEQTGLTSGQYVKIAFAYKTGDSALYINGSLAGTSTTSFISSTQMAEITLNDNVVYYGYPASQEINASALWKTRLTNDELERLTGVGFNTYTEMANYYNYITQ